MAARDWRLGGWIGMDEDIETRITAALPQLGGLGAVIRFDFGDDGQWLIDASGPVAKVSHEELEPACTIRSTAATLIKLLDGSLDPMLAFTLGRIKVSGSMGVAMKLANALG